MNYKKEKFQVAGVSHYSDSIMKDIAYENDDYLLSVKELSETYDVAIAYLNILSMIATLHSFQNPRTNMIRTPSVLKLKEF